MDETLIGEVGEMKYWAIRFLYAVICAVVTYGVCVFICMDTNPYNWPMAGRAFFMTMAIVSGVWASEQCKEYKSDETPNKPEDR